MGSLTSIFHAIPSPLSPNYFYDRIPIAFAASRAPGFLTSQGGLLFGPNAAAILSPALDPTALLGDVIYEGQLVLPIWQYNYTRFLLIMTFLGAWLYTDFPQYLTPTPGLAPTMLLYNLLDKFFPDPTPQPSAFDSVSWQWFFFSLHFLKVAFIYLLFYSGVFNPISLNPFRHRALRTRPVDSETLARFGPTGIRKASVAEWRVENARNEISELGIGAAHKAGLLLTLRDAGVQLTSGEGWDTPKDEFLVPPTTTNDTPYRFKLSIEYYRACYNYVTEHPSDHAERLEYYRRWGPKKGSSALLAYYAQRKAQETKERQEAKFLT